MTTINIVKHRNGSMGATLRPQFLGVLKQSSCSNNLVEIQDLVEDAQRKAYTESEAA